MLVLTDIYFQYIVHSDDNRFQKYKIRRAKRKHYLCIVKENDKKMNYMTVKVMKVMQVF